MKILVTGGAGFIGSFLCEALLKKGSVVCIDNLSTGKKSNIKHLMENPRFEFIQHDVTKPIDVEVDFIFHLASPASPVDYKKLPVETSLTNSLGTFNMLNLSRKNNARFLLASTSEVYGDPKEHPQREDYWGNVNPIGVRSCYDVSKRFAETLTISFHRKYGLDVRIARIFNTYGPRMRLDDGRAIPNFIVQSLVGKPITVYGDGTQTRSFCYVDDMVKGLLSFMFTDNLVGEVINLGSTDERTILDVANLIKKLTGSKSRIVFSSLPEDDPFKRRPDITKAKKLLGWEPKVDFETGLKKTIEWFKEELRK
jgi:nucleoside-diphosphate-sugar epimerase